MNSLFSEILSFFPNNHNINNANSINYNNQKKEFLKIKRNRCGKKGKINEKTKKRLGRIRKKSKRNGTHIHDRNAQDNMMRKIKNRIFLSANNLLNDILKKERKDEYKELNIDKIYKIKGEYSQELHRKFNIWLIFQDLKTIFSFKISKLYSENEDINQTIIKNIYNTNVNDYINTKKLLEMPFHEYIHKIFLNEDKNILKEINIDEKDEYKYKFDNFIYREYNNSSNNNKNKKSKKKEIQNDNDSRYLQKIKNLAHNYEEYFLGKSGRSSQKVKNDEIINKIIQSENDVYKQWEEKVKEIKDKYKLNYYILNQKE
jgi:hypothetical protein